MRDKHLPWKRIWTETLGRLVLGCIPFTGSVEPATAWEEDGAPPFVAIRPFDPATASIQALWRHGAAGNMDAQFELAQRYRNGTGLPRDYTAATALLDSAAKAGHMQSQSLLAAHYRVGLGVDQDIRAAVRWYVAAAEQGHVPSMHRLGRLYQAGGGVAGPGALEPDRDKALHWFRVGFEHACVACAHAAGLLLLDPPIGSADPIAARDWLLKAADRAHAGAQHSLADFLSRGAPGVPADPVEAYKWATLAAVQGRDEAAALRERLSEAMSPEQRVAARNRIADWRPMTD